MFAVDTLPKFAIWIVLGLFFISVMNSGDTPPTP